MTELSGDNGVDGDGARQVPPTAAAANDEGEENQSLPGPLANGEWEVEEIINSRNNSETNELEYEVKWLGHPGTSFVPWYDCHNAQLLIEKFEKNQKRLAAIRRREERWLLRQQAAAPPHHPVSAANSAASSRNEEAAEEGGAGGGGADLAMAAVAGREAIERAEDEGEAGGGGADLAMAAVAGREAIERAEDEGEAGGGGADPEMAAVAGREAIERAEDEGEAGGGGADPEWRRWLGEKLLNGRKTRWSWRWWRGSRMAAVAGREAIERAEDEGGAGGGGADPEMAAVAGREAIERAEDEGEAGGGGADPAMAAVAGREAIERAENVEHLEVQIDQAMFIEHHEPAQPEEGEKKRVPEFSKTEQNQGGQNVKIDNDVGQRPGQN
ncbi:hypothetical protein TYRP_019677 [Tyrophagus putrescentiae]|nr:hypothetical protein TYRP_019677 [Tyrophagus putrescentiae]